MTFAGTALTVRVGSADARYYPRVLAAVHDAPADERDHLLRVWASRIPANPDFVTPLELHALLWSTNYCTNLISWPGCRDLPAGTEAQGIAKDALNELSAPYRK
jgi:hypothetical protein